MKFFANTIRIKAEENNSNIYIGNHSFNGGSFYGTSDEFEPFKNQFDSISGPHPSISTIIPKPPKPPSHVSKVKPEMGDDFNQIMAHIKQQGGNPYLVGGFVRDHLQGMKPKDKDVEVYGMDASKLDKILKQYGRTDDVGASFGVKKFTHPNGDDYDFSLPRRENKQGQGHKGFQVDVDPTMTTEEGSSRRDFTHGSMMMDPLTGQIIDHHGGLQDLKDKTLRHTGPAFAEDPLRVLRGMQFAARFGHKMHPETAKLSRNLSSEYNTLSDDRIMTEWQKMAQKGEIPSMGLKVLQDTGWDEHYPELAGRMGPDKMKAVDEIAKQMKSRVMSNEDKNVLFFTTLTNDMTPEESASFLHRVKMPQPVQKRVAALKRGLESPHIHSGNSSRANVYNLAHTITPENVDNLTEVLRSIDHPRAQNIADTARQYGVHQSAPKPFINGDYLKSLGMKPNREFGEKLKAIYQAQLDGKINSPEEAMAMARGDSLVK
jgi:tRNA nucleotidyltransferase (CCA-adding enzyme)